MKRVSSPDAHGVERDDRDAEAQRQRGDLPDELADEGRGGAERVRGRGVGLVDGVDEAVRAEVARDLRHGPADAEPDRADGHQDERDLGHPGAPRAGGAEQVRHREENRQRPEAVDDRPQDRHPRMLADLDREG
jgi:hypothetical protein